MLKKLILANIFYCFFGYAQACQPSEIHIREQWVDDYEKEDGTVVIAHKRSEHCRVIGTHNYYQDKTSKQFKNLHTQFKPWKKSEKDILNKALEGLPPWLKKYKLNEILRGTKMKNNLKNPAAAIPFSKTLIVFDIFFKMTNQKEIIIHELSHLAVYDVDALLLKSFVETSGWTYGEEGKPIPPKVVILPDSQDSPSEDFANHVETYYSDKSKLKLFNIKTFEVLEKIIKSKEKEL